MSPGVEQRLLVLAPTGRDGPLACELLARGNLEAITVPDAMALCEAIRAGAGAVLVAEEALSPAALRGLSEVLAAQPPWSDLPIVIFAAAVESRAASARMQQMLEILGNVTFVDRPVRAATLVAVMRAALRARTRQYLARSLLQTLGEQEGETRKRADFEQHLIGIVSHDLRNPLAAIVMGTTALLRSGNLDERQLTGLMRVHRSAERAARMVNDLLDFTQARLGGGITLDRRAVNLHELARGVLDEIEASHPDREVRLAIEGDGQGVWDPDRLAQVLQNLVTNALKYSAPQSAIGVSLRGDEVSVTLAVHNHGPPIPEEKLPSIFQPLRRATELTDRTSRSVGLGLYIVSHIVDAHGGEIRAQSTASDGTTFAIRLPRRPPESPFRGP